MSKIKPVSFHEYTPEWINEFQQEKEAICTALNLPSDKVHHIGSTAIKGMPGKGIIDILVEVQDVNRTEGFEPQLLSIGYIYRPVPGREDSPFFTKPSEKPRSHNIHIADEDSEVARNHIMFRDYLNTTPDAAAKYEAYKRQTVTNHPEDWDAYSQGKMPVARSLLEEAKRWKMA